MFPEERKVFSLYSSILHKHIQNDIIDKPILPLLAKNHKQSNHERIAHKTEMLPINL